jgi:L-amino acid N-acyltransferase YncA
MTTNEMRVYPRRFRGDAGGFDIRMMGREDADAMLVFARSLPTHDLLFLPRDISQPKVLAAWIKELERGDMTSLLAVRDGAVLGCATIVRDPLSWSPHVGEIRVVVITAARGQGVGRALTQEAFAFALANGVEKMMAQMTADQTGAIALFESLGFRAEALLRDHVRDREGHSHDIVMLGHDVNKVASQMEAYGVASRAEQPMKSAIE